MTMLTEGPYAGEFLLSEAPGTLSRDVGVIDSSLTLKAGQVLGQILRAAQTVTSAAFAGNTGTGAIGSLTADANVDAGVYKVLIIEPATDAGAFVVYKPDGTIDGHGTVAVAYNGSVNFTLADATDFVAGDGFAITVAYAAGSLRYVPHDPAGTDGREVVAAILYRGVTTAAGETKQETLVTRLAEVILARLVWNGHNAGQKTAALATLAAKQIVAR